MQQSLSTKQYICPVCDTSISPLDGYTDYFNCPECGGELSSIRSVEAVSSIRDDIYENKT